MLYPVIAMSVLKSIRNSFSSQSCSAGKVLIEEWHLASAPFNETRMELLELYEERKASAKAELIFHRQTCSVCQGSTLPNSRVGTPI